MEVREMLLYSEKVDADEVKNLFDQAVKSKLPFLGFLDMSHIFSPNALKIVVKRSDNTIKFFAKEKKGLSNLSALVFPFKFCDVTRFDRIKGSYLPFPKIYMLNGAKHDFLDFMLKENITELSISISKIMGLFHAYGTVVDADGRKGLLRVGSPNKFLSVNLEKNPSIYIEVLEPIPKKMHMSSNYPVFEETGMSLGVDNYDPLQHTLIAGTSGAGKSKALYVLIKAMEAKYRNNARVVILDPHGEFAKMFPDAKLVNFIDNYIEPLDVGGQKSPMLTQLISQLIASSIGQENKYSERVLFYAVHLLTSIDKLELNNISTLLTDASVKAEYVSQCDNPEIKRFFDEEFNDIYIHHFNNAILPILNFIGEYQLYLGKEKKRENLVGVLGSNNVTVVSFDPKFFGRRMISFLAGAIINQMYILAISEKLMDKPTILVVDEFPRVETKVIKDILAETRKFNLYAYLSCQYLGQLSKEVLDGIISNVRNIISFKVNRQDATLLSSIMEIKIEEYFKKHRAQTELEESKKEMFVRLHQRECITRLFDGQKYLLPMKLRVVDVKKWGYRDPIMGKVFEDDEPEVQQKVPTADDVILANENGKPEVGKPEIPYDLQEFDEDAIPPENERTRKLRFNSEQAEMEKEPVEEKTEEVEEQDEEPEEKKLPEPMIDEKNGKTTKKSKKTSRKKKK